MDFDDQHPRRLAEPFVPMINVVFLLLIFFLMTAQIAPPDPFEVSPPQTADGGDPTGEATLYLSLDGESAFQDLKGEEALTAAIAEAEEAGLPLKLRADRGMEASLLAARLKTLAAMGASSVELLTTAR